MPRLKVADNTVAQVQNPLKTSPQFFWHCNLIAAYFGYWAVRLSRCD
jgi:hypothetical protein